MRYFLAVLFLASLCFAGDLPDAPLPQTTCVENNGKPCPGWLHKLIGQYPPLGAGSPIDPNYVLPKPAGFWTFRKSWQDPPLRTNKEMFKSKTYVATQIGGAIAMVIACRNKRSGEDYGSEIPAVLGVDALAYVGGRFFTQSFAVAPGVYQMVHYSITGSK